MDVGLDIRMLTKCFAGNHIAKLEDDIYSFEAIQSLINDNIVSQVDIEKVVLSIHILNDVPCTLRNVKTFLKANECLDKATKLRRIIAYLKNKVTMLDVLCGLLASDYQSVADLLLRRVYQKKFAEQTTAVPKIDPGDRNSVHALVKKLKQIVDSKSINNPKKVVRKMAIEYKNQLCIEQDVCRKQRLADRYLGVIAAEIDSDYYSPSGYVSIQALMSEFQRVMQMSSCPSLFEGLFHIRLASHYSVCGQIDNAKELVTQALVVTQDTAMCPEVSNIWYETLNVFLLEFEQAPTRENRDKVVQTGYTGIQSTSESRYEIQQLWISHFLIRMAFACLGIGIRGNVIPGVNVTQEDINLAEVLLAGVVENELTMRRRMFYSLAKGRFYQLKEEWPNAAGRILEAKTLALKLGFEEAKYITGLVTEQTHCKSPQ